MRCTVHSLGTMLTKTILCLHRRLDSFLQQQSAQEGRHQKILLRSGECLGTSQSFAPFAVKNVFWCYLRKVEVGLLTDGVVVLDRLFFEYFAGVLRLVLSFACGLGLVNYLTRMLRLVQYFSHSSLRLVPCFARMLGLVEHFSGMLRFVQHLAWMLRLDSFFLFLNFDGLDKGILGLYGRSNRCLRRPSRRRLGWRLCWRLGRRRGAWRGCTARSCRCLGWALGRRR